MRTTVRAIAALPPGALAAVALLLILAFPAAPAAEEGDEIEEYVETRELVVVVNRANPATSISLADLQKLFLGKRALWPNGWPVNPCDLAEPGLPEPQTSRAQFSQRYLNKDMTTLKSYWIRMIFSGKGHPPAVYPRTGQVLAHVAADEGGLGYLPRRSVTDRVKVIAVIDNTAP
ncbi:MAG: hypothetical protein HY804_06305 [Nitrospinae bacterium]|nr:hypothetical protein [Nitrospinota bacterium]